MNQLKQDTPLAWSESWSRVGRLKSVQQWRSKLVSLSVGRATVEGLTIPAVGDYLYRHTRKDGTLAADPLQAAPAAS